MSLDMHHTIIFHGTHGSPDGNWFVWLREQLKEKDAETYIPTLPTPEGQSVESWLSACKMQIPNFSPDDEITFIGHSCGATFLLHYLEQIEFVAKQSVFVSPVMGELGIEEYDKLNSSFIAHDFDWNVIKERAGNVSVLHGDNDPYVPISHAHDLSHALDVQTTVIENGGHLNMESGYTAFPLLLDILTS